MWEKKLPDDFVPLLIEALALLFNASLDPGCDVVTQLGQGLILRRGKTTFVLWCLRTWEGLEPAASGTTHCCILHNVWLWRQKQRNMEFSVSGSQFCVFMNVLCLLSWVTDLRPGCGWAGESSSHCWTCAGLNIGYTGIRLSSIYLWWRCTSSCCHGSLLQIYASAVTGRKCFLENKR